MSKHHLVGISTQGYFLVSSHSTESEAVDAMASFRKTSRSVCVLRNGSTGKRESVCEVESRIGRRI